MIDIQASEPQATGFAIELVGVQNLNYPFRIKDEASQEEQQALTTWTMGVSLSESQRGTHMSRFLTELHALSEKSLSLTDHFRFAENLLPVLAAESAELRTDFSWFRKVSAPVSGLAGFIDCKVSFVAVAGKNPSKTIRIAVPAKALCPCSKAISDRGAHNQRSEISVELEYETKATPVSINHVFSLLELSASSPVYPVLKRDDEKYVTEHAYDNPVFVEDIVRRAASRLVDLPSIKGFKIQAINFESIHAHDCFARISYRR